jgi:septal ring factor EnvC (AmiA/AmiB activator)
MLSDDNIKYAIGSVGTVLVGFIIRWLTFRFTLDGRWAIGANEEMQAFRKELRDKIAKLEIQVGTQDEKILSLTRENTMLEMKLVSAEERIKELLFGTEQRDKRINELEDRLNGTERRNS